MGYYLRKLVSDIMYLEGRLPEITIFGNEILIYDIYLESEFSSFISQFPHRLGLIAGEQTKDFSHLSKVFELVSSQNGLDRPHFFALGGGSIGDFVGLAASLWKRGCPFTVIPTTWLSAIDSAHGGKNAVNFKGVKNQIGTFYFPDQVLISDQFFVNNSAVRLSEAWSEVLKIALIDSAELYDKVCLKKLNYWPILPELIQAKLKIVDQDPCEQMGLRHVLNFGHTIGHIIESELGLSHGKSVGFGIRYAYEFSKHLKYLETEFDLPLIPSLEELKSLLKKIKNFESLLSQDKKFQNGMCRFVFIEKPGQTFVQPTQISTILNFYNTLIGP